MIKIKPGVKADIFLASYIFGYSTSKPYPEAEECITIDQATHWYEEIPRYTTDVRAALCIAQYIASATNIRIHGTLPVIVEMEVMDAGGHIHKFVAEGHTVAFTICLAALKVKESSIWEPI